MLLLTVALYNLAPRAAVLFRWTGSAREGPSLSSMCLLPAATNLSPARNEQKNPGLPGFFMPGFRISTSYGSGIENGSWSFPVFTRCRRAMGTIGYLLGTPQILGYTLSMTNAIQHLLSAFNALPQESQKEVLVRLLRLPIEIPYTSPTDEELRYTADAVFLELDRREAQA